MKGIIERDIKNEYGGILERLNSAEGTKLAILQHDLSEIQKDVNRIDDILKSLDELTLPQQQPSPIVQMTSLMMMSQGSSQENMV